MWRSPEFLSLSFLFWSVLVTDALVLKQENSLFGPYQAGEKNLVWWDLTGSAQLGENVIRLTTDETWKQGAIWNNYPVLCNDWELHMQFHIHGKGIHHNGDGMAIWYAKDALHTGPVFGSKDYFSGLGVFIDTFEDQVTPHKHRHPYISAVVNNGSFHYEHDEDGTAGQVGGCHIQVRNQESPTKLAISYIHHVLTVFTDVAGTQQWAECFKAYGVFLPTGYYFGISASTGELSDNHDVVAVTTLDMNFPDIQPEDRSHVIPHAEIIEVPIKPLPEDVLEELQKNELKREVREEVREEEEVEEEMREEKRIRGGEGKKHESKAGVTAPPASFTRKVIYIGGIGLLLYIAITMFKKYNAQRKERMQKRLY